MKASSWALPVIISAIGLAWISYLGLTIWRTPEAGRPTEAELATALTSAVRDRDEPTLQSLFASKDLPPRYARDYLAQVPAAARVSTAATSDAYGPMLTLRVATSSDLSCTTWRVEGDDRRVTLAPTPALSAPCPAR